MRYSPSEIVFQNSKGHKIGVCCIAKNPTDPNTILTGSYDEYLRVWDLRSISRPIEGEKPEVVDAYNQHCSLTYGADWQKRNYYQESRPRVLLWLLARFMTGFFAYGCQKVIFATYSHISLVEFTDTEPIMLA
ncbi:hypothetical protein CRYUN_Cryun19dG0048600 [Craigia yunnanensis]